MPTPTDPPSPITLKSKGKTPHPDDLKTMLVLCQRGAFADAERFALALTRRLPSLGMAWKILGTALYQQHRLEQAVPPMQKAAKLLAWDAEAHGNLGITLLELGQVAQAEPHLRKSLAIKPDSAEVRCNLGEALRQSGHLDEAQAQFRRALELKPNLAAAYVNLGITLQQQSRVNEGEQMMRRALEIEPDSARTHNNLGLNLRDQGRYVEAEASFQRALQIYPDFAECHTNLGLALQEQGKLAEAETSLRRALNLLPNLEVAHSNLLFALNYHPDKDAEQIFDAYRDYNAHFGLAHQAMWRPHENSRDSNRRLRIGYLSPDFVRHPVHHFLEPLFAHHDKQVVEIFAYAQLSHEDAVTQRYKGYVDHWLPTVAWDDDALAERIRADRIDILVDLAGHTANNRLGVCLRKPAPISVSWMGYGYTTGLTAIDYYLVDAAAAPEGCDALFAERPWRLPTPGFAYRPDEDMGEAGPLPALTRGYVTFCTLTRAIRINHRTIRVWSEILRRLPQSKLVVDSATFRDSAMRQSLAEKFATHGVGADRLVLGYHTPPWDVLRGVDIGLDCFPHNSGSTLVENLYMGVPFITLAGRPSMGRLGASILEGAGHPEWIAYTEDEYIDKAVALASDLTLLAKWRARLRTDMQAGPHMDEAGFAAKLESAFREMFAIWSASGR